MRVEQLTFTRYVAALTVVFFHYGKTVFPADIPLLNPVVAAGPVAVSYFYVLSGVIMAIAYYQPGQQRPLKAWRYWLARAARIYPVYLLALLLMIAAKRHASGSDPVTVGLSLSMLQAWFPGFPLTLNSPGWSLSVEAFFYLCFPWLVMLAHRRIRQLGIAALLLWLATQTGHTLLLNSGYYAPFNWLHDAIFYNPLMHLNTFLIGFVAGVWLLEGKLRWLHDPGMNLAGLAVVSFLTLALLMLRPLLIEYSGIKFDYTNGLIAPLFLLFILLLALNDGGISAFLRHKWLVLLGEASFSLYILQKPLHGLYEKLVPAAIPPDSAVHFYLFVIVLTATALFSFWFFETPLRRSINNFVNRSP
ncbi:acyltransferase [Candidatus Thiothrix sp. Deng01]|uniref:Acyltransferase n=1 Tax=Candidatus Thiothrix phosphatis TaxID=3112415 RepID=A0ABU6CSL5_9GAMM|nr:acyltransferase [Candidatus Thiothrix sp. Deng01]MEB4589566.1 acyltransferase [Candidatus Thiothrix sp. Deng01]